MRAGRARQRAEAVDELGYRVRRLQWFVATIERRQLHRDAVVAQAGRVRIAAGGHCQDGLVVGGKVAQRLGIGSRRLSEHVIGEAETAQFAVRGTPQRMAHVAAEHELPTQHLHGRGHHRPHPACVPWVGAHDSAREHERARERVDAPGG